MSMNENDLLKVSDVATMLQISRASAWRLVWSGELPASRLSARTVRVSRSDLEAWIASRPAAALSA
jgi:excisionase family DNA binding protein